MEAVDIPLGVSSVRTGNLRETYSIRLRPTRRRTAGCLFPSPDLQRGINAFRRALAVRELSSLSRRPSVIEGSLKFGSTLALEAGQWKDFRAALI